MKKKTLLASAILALVLLSAAYFLFLRQTGINGLYNSIQGFDKVDRNKEVCLKIEKNNTTSMECFTPNKIEDFLKEKDLTEKEFIDNFRGSSVTKDKILTFDEEPLFYQLYDKIHPNTSNIKNVSETYKDIKKKLEYLVNKNEGVLDEYLAYYYMKNLEGDYKEAEIFKNKICTKFKFMCSKDLVYAVFKGKILDDKKAPVSGVRIKIAGKDKEVLSQTNGEFYISSEVSPYTKVRLLSVKDGYSDGVADFDIISPVRKQNFERDFVISKSDNLIKIDTNNLKIEGKGVSISNKNYLIKTDWSEYRIPFDSIVKENGAVFEGKLKVYTWEFNKSSDLTSLVNSDIFDEVAGYAGDLMKTFGMPYIMFLSESGEKLHILKSNPMILKTRIQEMRALETNKDKIYEPLTKKDLEFLVSKSKELGGYPIDRMFLFNNNILRFPAFWVFDQYKGVWINEGMKVLNTEGDGELRFYTLSEKIK
ncbi:MAG: hypothetical protein PHS92_00660 [Candidatus Gracilibacteria bacterium]|nr:hypothetical protein [Candidatus Gracilibacteria bacterium]